MSKLIHGIRMANKKNSKLLAKYLEMHSVNVENQVMNKNLKTSLNELGNTKKRYNKVCDRSCPN